MTFIAEKKYTNWKGDHHVAINADGDIYTNRFGVLESFGHIAQYGKKNYAVRFFVAPLTKEDLRFTTKQAAIDYAIETLGLERT